MPEGDAGARRGRRRAPPTRRRWPPEASRRCLVVLVLAVAAGAVVCALRPRPTGGSGSTSPSPADPSPAAGAAAARARRCRQPAGRRAGRRRRRPRRPGRPGRRTPGAGAGCPAPSGSGRHVAVGVAQLSDGTVVYRDGAAARDAGVDDEAAHHPGGARGARAGPPVHHRGGARRRPRAGSRWSAAATRCWPGRRRPATAATRAAPTSTRLARATAQALRAAGRTRVRLGYDASLFTGPGGQPALGAVLRPRRRGQPDHRAVGRRGPRRGRARRPQPRTRPGRGRRSSRGRCAGTASRSSAGRSHGGAAGRRQAARRPCRAPRSSQIVQHVLEVSDNEGAEVLARQVAIAEEQPASFAGGVPRGPRRCSTGLGVDLDRRPDLRRQRPLPRRPAATRARCSTCSRPPRARTTPGCAACWPSLPVAGFTGSLAYRFDDGADAGLGHGPGQDRHAAPGVHGLAGMVTVAATAR